MPYCCGRRRGSSPESCRPAALELPHLAVGHRVSPVVHDPDLVVRAHGTPLRLDDHLARIVVARAAERLFRLAWDIAGTSFGSRQVLYERFFAGDPPRAGTGRECDLPEG